MTPSVAPSSGSQAPPTAQPGGSDLTRKAARGAVALGFRQVLSYGSNVIGGVILARILSPAEFGFYAVVALFLAFLNVFGGTGFAGNLIRTPEWPSLRECRTIFTIQQITIAIICAVICLASSRIAGLYHLSHNGPYFFQFIALSVILTSLMVMPQIQMERELAFDKLAVIEVTQAFSFNLVAVVLAWRGFGILSFAVALVVRAALGALLANIISPWKLGFAWDIAALKTHVRYGLALQGGQLLSMLKDSITPTFVGMFLGVVSMGYATWAMTFASYSIILLMPLQRIYLPFFARIQDDHSSLRYLVSRTLWMVNAIAAPLVILPIVLAKPITILVFGPKWLPALPIFYCFAAGAIFSPSSAPMIGLLNALGKSHQTLLITAMWMATTWALGVPLIMLFGLLGYGIAVFGVQLTNLVLFWMVWKDTHVSPWPAFWPSWPLALATGLGILLLQSVLPARNLITLILYLAVGLIAYASIFWIESPQRVQNILRLARGTA